MGTIVLNGARAEERGQGLKDRIDGLRSQIAEFDQQEADGDLRPHHVTIGPNNVYLQRGTENFATDAMVSNASVDTETGAAVIHTICHHNDGVRIDDTFKMLPNADRPTYVQEHNGVGWVVTYKPPHEGMPAEWDKQPPSRNRAFWQGAELAVTTGIGNVSSAGIGLTAMMLAGKGASFAVASLAFASGWVIGAAGLALFLGNAMRNEEP